MKSWKIAYWIVTVLFSLFIIATALPDILQVPGAVQLFQELGYPTYVMLIVGWAKVLGIIGIWQQWWPFLREWAYAGLVIDFVGAFASHRFSQDAAFLLMPSVVALVLVISSYALLRKAYGDQAKLAALS
jgi:uncharacterized membrane protein YedE/YeeE